MERYKPIQRLNYSVSGKEVTALFSWLHEHAWTAQEAREILYGKIPGSSLELANSLNAYLPHGYNLQNYPTDKQVGRRRTRQQDFDRAILDLKRFITGKTQKPFEWLQIGLIKFGYDSPWLKFFIDNPEALEECPDQVALVIRKCINTDVTSCAKITKKKVFKKLEEAWNIFHTNKNTSKLDYDGDSVVSERFAIEILWLVLRNPAAFSKDRQKLGDELIKDAYSKYFYPTAFPDGYPYKKSHPDGKNVPGARDDYNEKYPLAFEHANTMKDTVRVVIDYLLHKGFLKAKPRQYG